MIGGRLAPRFDEDTLGIDEPWSLLTCGVHADDMER